MQDSGDRLVVRRRFRVQVSLVKVKGTWLVDDFTPLTGESRPAGDGSLRRHRTPTGHRADPEPPTEGASP